MRGCLFTELFNGTLATINQLAIVIVNILAVFGALQIIKE